MIQVGLQSIDGCLQLYLEIVKHFSSFHSDYANKL